MNDLDSFRLEWTKAMGPRKEAISGFATTILLEKWRSPYSQPIPLKSWSVRPGPCDTTPKGQELFIPKFHKNNKGANGLFNHLTIEEYFGDYIYDKRGSQLESQIVLNGIRILQQAKIKKVSPLSLARVVYLRLIHHHGQHFSHKSLDDGTMEPYLKYWTTKFTRAPGDKIYAASASAWIDGAVKAYPEEHKAAQLFMPSKS